MTNMTKEIKRRSRVGDTARKNAQKTSPEALAVKFRCSRSSILRTQEGQPPKWMTAVDIAEIIKLSSYYESQLKIWRENTNQQIAKDLGVSLETVKYRLRQAGAETRRRKKATLTIKNATRSVKSHCAFYGVDFDNLKAKCEELYGSMLDAPTSFFLREFGVLGGAKTKHYSVPEWATMRLSRNPASVRTYY